MALPFRIIPLEFIGKNSLYFLIVHSVDTFFFGSTLWSSEKVFGLSCLYRIIYVTAGALILIAFKMVAGRIGKAVKHEAE